MSLSLKLSASQGTLQSHLVEGWDIPPDGGREVGYVWSTDSSVRMVLPSPGRAAKVSVEVIPFIADGKVPHQDVWIYADGLFCGFGRLTRPGTVSGIIDPRPDAKATVVVTLVLPDATVPSELGILDDRRRLAVAVRSVEYSAGRG